MLTPIEKKLCSSACSCCSFSPLCLAQAHSLVSNTRHLKRKEALCVLNNKFQNIYIVKKGALKAYQVDIHGYEHIHAFYFTGETLGYRAIHAGHHISNVVALTDDTVVCEVAYDQFIDKLKSKPELYEYVLALISKQLTTSFYVNVATAEQRIAAFIIDLSSRTPAAVPLQALTLPMSRQDIGSYLRLTAETVSRVLSRFKRDHIISIDLKQIRIINPKKLQELAQ